MAVNLKISSGQPGGYRLSFRFQSGLILSPRHAVVAAIFLLLYLTFHSFKQALLVIGNIPFPLVGGIAALWLRNMNLNLSALIGFIALFGVAMLNGVVTCTR
jgi:Cu/Ag efflux pump CusA